MDTGKVHPMIQMIKIADIYEHPDNPRKNLGDLTELAESIRKNGIMQNLTVVPGHFMSMKEFKDLYVAEGGKASDAKYAYNKDTAYLADGYTVVIGHRRRAAAKAAGLEELPCIISDMDERQQLCTMMEENMQRQDLTIPEQAYGFQYMLDLGETVESIAKKTGFSESTVRHRLEIAKLDKKALKNNFAGEDGGYQLGLNDLIELEKIRSVEKRNEILRNAYSQADLRSRIQKAKDKERIDEAMAELAPLLESMGIKECPKSINEWDRDVSTVKTIDLEKKLPDKISLATKEGAKYYWRIDYYYVALKVIEKAKKEEKELTPEDKARAEREDRKSRLCEEEKRLYSLLDRQIKLVDEGQVKLRKEIDEQKACRVIWEIFVRNGSSLYFYDIAAFRLGEQAWNIGEQEKADCIEGFLGRKMVSQMMVMLMMTMKFKPELHDYKGLYRKDIAANIKRITDLLVKLYGFSPLPESMQKLLDGTHELYGREDNDC